MKNQTVPPFELGTVVIVRDRACWSRDRKCVVFKDDGGLTIGVCTTEGHISWADRDKVEAA